MKRIAVGVAACMTLCAAIPGRAEGPVTIGYHEPAAGFRLVRPDPRRALAKPADGLEPGASFSAFGRQFDIELHANGRLAAGLLARGELAAAPPLFRGSLRGLAGSWVRLALVDGNPVGAVWDGSELFLVDTAGNFGVAGTAPGAVAVVRANDLHIPVDTLRFAGAPLNSAASKPAPATAAGGPADLASFPLGLVLDAAYMRDFADPVAYALSVANVADGIFVAQLGLHINVEHLQAYPAEPDPFTASDGYALLDQLGDLKDNDAFLRPMGVAHLLTRTQLEGDTVGVATIGRLCESRQSVSLTRALGGVTSALIMAHELGHNFGAEHDGESGSVCASAPRNYIMAATINDARLFSSCSVQTMRPFIDAAACRTAIPVADVMLIAPATASPVWYGEELRLDYSVYNAGIESTLQNVAQFTTDNPEPVLIYDVVNRSCASTDVGPVTTCDLQSIHGGQSEPVSIGITPKTAGALVLDAAVNAANDGNLANNFASLQFEVLPATDLGGEFAYSNDGIDWFAQPGWTVSMLAGARNHGDFPSDASIAVSSNGGHALTPTAGCTLEAPDRMHCDFGTLPPGEARRVEFGVTLDPAISLHLRQVRSEHFFVDVTGTLHDVNATNDRRESALTLIGSIHDVTLDIVRPPQPVQVGETGTFEARVTNRGPDDAPDLVLNSFGNGLEFTDWSIGRGACAESDGFLACDIDRLNSGDFVDLAVTYTADAGQTYPLNLQVYTESGLDTDWENGLAQANVVVSDNRPPPATATAVGSSGGGGVLRWPELGLLLALFVAGRRYPGSNTVDPVVRRASRSRCAAAASASG